MVSRRVFLAALGASAGTFFARQLPNDESDEWYASELLRVRLRRPPDWHFLSRMHYEVIRDEHRLNVPDDIMDDVKDALGRPSVVVCRYLEPCAGVNPNVALSVGPGEEDADAVATLSEGLEIYHRYVKGLEWEIGPEAAMIGGLPAGRAVIRYLHEASGGISALCRVETYHVERAGVSYTFSFGDSVDGWCAEVTDGFRRVRDSVRFA